MEEFGIWDFGFRISDWFIISLVRIVVFAIVAVVLFIAASSGLLILLIGLNGYSEAQATPGLIAYVVLCLATVPGMGAVGAVMTRVLVEKKGFGKGGAATSAVIGAAIVGVLIVVTGMIVSFVIAEVLRRMK